MVHLEDPERKLGPQPLHRPSCWPNRTCLFCRYGTGESMSVRTGMSARVVSSRLWNRSPIYCRNHMFISPMSSGDPIL